jgi:hypothetical protein
MNTQAFAAPRFFSLGHCVLSKQPVSVLVGVRLDALSPGRAVFAVSRSAEKRCALAQGAIVKLGESDQA